MPESIENLREARQALAKLPPEEAKQELEAFRLSPKEELFFFFGDDPVGFALNCFKWPKGRTIHPYQRDIMRRVVRHGRVCVRGPHGLGKTATAGGWITNWFIATRDGLIDWKIITTAGSHYQLEEFFWPEVRKWADKLRWDVLRRDPYNKIHEMQQYHFKGKTGNATKVASTDHQLIEGAHATHLMYVFDESKAIPGDTFDAAEGAFSNAGPDSDNEAYAIAISTPGEPFGRFYDIQMQKPGYEDWDIRHVTLDEVIDAGVVARHWAEQRARQWGPESSTYKNRVEGEFASSDSSSVIPADWVEAAQERWKVLYEYTDTSGLVYKGEGGEPELESVGADIAYGGEDSTVLAPRHGNNIRELLVDEYTKDTHKIARRVAGIIDRSAARNRVTATVDIVGWGAGTFDNLRAWGYLAVPFHAQHQVKGRRDETGELSFADKRSAAYWNLREILNPDSGYEVALPPDPELLGELSAPLWDSKSGKIVVESKDKLRDNKRLGRSPDKADAVVMAFWEEKLVAPPPRAISSIRRKRQSTPRE